MSNAKGTPQATPDCPAWLDWDGSDEAIWVDGEFLWQHADGHWTNKVVSVNEQRMAVALERAWMAAKVVVR